MVDITQNLNSGDLTVLTALRFYRFQMAQNSNMVKYHVKHNDDSGDNNPQELTRIGGVQNGQLISSGNNEIYFSTEIPFYAVINPRERGALGTAYDIRQGNALFVSGPLNGCSVAVLKKDDIILFIHAGADAGTSESGILDPDGVNNDLYRIVQMHEGVNQNVHMFKGRDIRVEPIKQEELANYFHERGYSGMIYHPAEANRLQVYREVSVQEYNATMCSSIYAVTPNACHVLLVDSETGNADQMHIL